MDITVSPSEKPAAITRGIHATKEPSLSEQWHVLWNAERFTKRKNRTRRLTDADFNAKANAILGALTADEVPAGLSRPRPMVPYASLDIITFEGAIRVALLDADARIALAREVATAVAK